MLYYSMKTKIALLHLHVPLPPEESYRSIVSFLVEGWATMYKRSGTTMEPVLLHDGKSIIPKKWPYEVAQLTIEEPPKPTKILDRVVWLKSQLYNQLGRCLVVDWDCLFLQNLDHLDDLNEPMAMPISRNEGSFGSGLVLMNSPDICQRVGQFWNQSPEGALAHVNSKIGFGLSKKYDCSWNKTPFVLYDPQIEKNAKDAYAIHFEGDRKKLIWEFLSRRGIKW